MARSVPVSSNVVRLRTAKHTTSNIGFSVLLAACFLGVFSAVFFMSGTPTGQALAASPEKSSAAALTAQPDSITAKFGICGAGPRSTCVVDGDTIWLYGTKIRIADINTPEVSNPGCQAEADLAHQATNRLAHLLNQASFSVSPVDRDEDRFGRKLRVITRGGQSLGAQLVAEGLAEEWSGVRIDWC